MFYKGKIRMRENLQKARKVMDSYIKIPGGVVSDKALSLRAKGLYAMILSLPSSWTCSIQYLTEESGESKHVVCKTVRELESKGYLERRQIIDENGCFAGMEYVLKEGIE